MVRSGKYFGSVPIRLADRLYVRNDGKNGTLLDLVLERFKLT